MKLGDQIKMARKAAGLGQQELADALEVTKQAVIWWESEVHAPRLPVLRKMELLLKAHFNVTGTKSSNPDAETYVNIKPETLRLAITIGQLPKASRDAILTTIKCMAVAAGMNPK